MTREPHPSVIEQQQTAERDVPQTSSDPSTIVFFDGVCGLCNSTVQFLMDKDVNHVLMFAPLQGETAERQLAEDDRQLNSIVFVDGGKTWTKSSAVVRIFKKLPQPWSFAGTALWLIPKPLRDVGYRIVAKLRYRVFGRQETCRMPTAEDAGRMLP